ncbi:MAG TPA: hypothetical protein GXX14_09105 [Clostridiaceae bacterium]|nr:hypothetical protein [Clostridiaceae bacterium]
MNETMKHFKEPPRQYSPVGVWWWSGEEVKHERLRWQMERFAEGGLYNLMIVNLAPTGPIFGADPDNPPFHSEEWWHLLDSVCRDASELGIKIWFYDQIGFSGTNFQADIVRDEPEYTGQSLESITTEGNGSLEIECPDGGEPLYAAAVPIDMQGNVTGSFIPVEIKERKVCCSLPGRYRLRLIYTVNRGFDYFSPAACKCLLDRIHGEIKRRLGHWLGNVIVGSFQDELPHLPSWSKNFREEFLKRKGYDILPYLPFLWEIGYSDASAKTVRIDYYSLRAELSEEAFFKPFFDWHKSNNLICGFDQQSPARAGEPIGTVRIYADYLRTHRWFGAPGSDHFGEVKIHSSIAHLNDRPRVWIEAFHSTGWGGTLEETFDWLMPWLIGGGNLYCPHAVYYSTRGGWWEWAPLSTCWRQPYWQHYSIFSKAVSRLCYLIACGRHVCDIGIMYPTTTIQSGLTLNGKNDEAKLANDTYIDLCGQTFWTDIKTGVLYKDKRDFDVLSDEALAESKIIDGSIYIRKESYKVIILPGCSVVKEETARVLCQFVESGGLLIAVGVYPQPIKDDDKYSIRLADLFKEGKAKLVPSPDDVPDCLANVPRYVEAPVPVLHRVVGEHDVLFIPAVYPCATHQKNPDWRNPNYDFDAERYSRNMSVKIKGNCTDICLWDPLTGSKKLPEIRNTGDGIEVNVPFNNGAIAVLVFRWQTDCRQHETTNAGTLTSEPYRAVNSFSVYKQLEPEWESEIIQTIDNLFGDFDKPAYQGAPPVSTWFFEHRFEENDGDGIVQQWYKVMDDNGWEKVQATFGIFAHWTGPKPENELPMPTGMVHQESPGIASSEWKPLVYSLTRGIPRDSIHAETLGTKGHVPEEFFHFGNVKQGQSIQIRTGIWSESEQDICFALGARAAKKAWLNGIPLDVGKQGYLSMAPARLKKGLNLLEIRLTSEQDSVLRGYWAFVNKPERFIRPEWLAVPEKAKKDDVICFVGNVVIPFNPVKAVIQVAAGMPCRVIVNDEEIGRQGGYDPYNSTGRIQPYTVNNLKQGRNIIVIEASVQASQSGVLVDGLIWGEGDNKLSFVSNEKWKVYLPDGNVQPVKLQSNWGGILFNVEPSNNYLWRRPHPLLGAEWLEDTPAENVVAEFTTDAFMGACKAEWFRWILPPGAYLMKAHICGKAELWVNGEKVAIEDGQAELPWPELPGRCAVLRVIPDKGLNKGAVFKGPVVYQTGRGRIKTGNWEDQGLGSYSGGILYRQNLTLSQIPEGQVYLDLGRVRGTAEIYVNRKHAGTCIWSPYIVDVTGLLTEGDNEIKVTVFNTLAPYLYSVSPTNYVYPGQRVSGLFGPVRLLEKKG